MTTKTPSAPESARGSSESEALVYGGVRASSDAEALTYGVTPGGPMTTQPRLPSPPYPTGALVRRLDTDAIGTVHHLDYPQGPGESFGVAADWRQPGAPAGETVLGSVPAALVELAILGRCGGHCGETGCARSLGHRRGLKVGEPEDRLDANPSILIPPGFDLPVSIRGPIELNGWYGVEMEVHARSRRVRPGSLLAHIGLMTVDEYRSNESGQKILSLRMAVGNDTQRHLSSAKLPERLLGTYVFALSLRAVETEVEVSDFSFMIRRMPSPERCAVEAIAQHRAKGEG